MGGGMGLFVCTLCMFCVLIYVFTSYIVHLGFIFLCKFKKKKIKKKLENYCLFQFQKLPHFALFRANIYIFTFGAFSEANIDALETHPINFDLERNGSRMMMRS